MPSARKLSRYAIIVGLLCLPAPVYLGYGIAYATPDVTEAPYHGPEVDPASGSPTALDIRKPYTETSIAARDTQSTLVGAADPENTSAVVDRAIRDGAATATRAQVRADLRDLAARDRFLYADGSYYEFTVSGNGSTVTTRPAADARVVRASVDTAVVDYADLEPTTKRAVDAIIANTSAEGDGDYRPRTDNPVVEREPFLVQRADSVYAIYRDGGTYIGSEFLAFVVGPPVTLVGLVLLVAGGVGRYRTREG